MDQIMKVKKIIRMRTWQEKYEAYQASGMPVKQWCSETGINEKTFYYRLRKLREQVPGQHEQHEIVPLTGSSISLECLCRKLWLE